MINIIIIALILYIVFFLYKINKKITIIKLHQISIKNNIDKINNKLFYEVDKVNEKIKDLLKEITTSFTDIELEITDIRDIIETNVQNSINDIHKTSQDTKNNTSIVYNLLKSIFTIIEDDVEKIKTMKGFTSDIEDKIDEIKVDIINIKPTIKTSRVKKNKPNE